MADLEKSKDPSSTKLDGFTLLFNDEVSIVCGFRSIYNYVHEKTRVCKTERTSNPWHVTFTTFFYAHYLMDLIHGLKESSFKHDRTWISSFVSDIFLSKVSKLRY